VCVYVRARQLCNNFQLQK